MKNADSSRFLTLTVIWAVLALLWFFWVKEPVVGAIWACGGLVYLIFGIVRYIRGKKK